LAILRWKRWKGWVAVGVVTLCALALLFLIGSTALDKGTAAWAKAFLFFVGAIAVAATLAASDGVPWKSRAISSWLAPKPIALAFVAVFAAFGTMTDALSLFEPRPAVESRPGEIERNVKALREDVKGLAPKPEAKARIWAALPGVWGEPGCDAVTYRFAVKEQALTVDGLKRPPGAPAYRLVATILTAKGDQMEVRGEQPAEARGAAASFSYTTNGATERLIWHDHLAGAVPVELDRCG
jgi:hypothetical protein